MHSIDQLTYSGAVSLVLMSLHSHGYIPEVSRWRVAVKGIVSMLTDGVFMRVCSGLAISNSDIIREVHNSMARPEALVPDEDDREKKVSLVLACLPPRNLNKHAHLLHQESNECSLHNHGSVLR